MPGDAFAERSSRIDSCDSVDHSRCGSKVMDIIGSTKIFTRKNAIADIRLV